MISIHGLVRNKYPFFLVSALIAVFDRVSKIFFERFLSGIEGNSIRALGDEFARFTLAYNEGIAFSIPLGGRYFLSSVSFAASVVIIFIIIKTDIKKRTELWGLSFILGGAVGNMTDRIFTGRVIDFIDCDFPDFIMYRWPIFNIADSFVTLGMIFLVIHYIFMDKKAVEKG